MLEKSLFGTPQPYGKPSREVMDKFEIELGKPLPAEFREYLLSYNGAEFAKRNLRLPDGGMDCIRIQNVFGLHDGPSYSRMQDNWQLWCNYDLDRWRKRLAKFVVFADTTSGDLLSIDLKDGSVWLNEHDGEAGLLSRLPGRHSQIAKSFHTFFDLLISDSEYSEMTTSEPGHEEFQARLEDIKKQRAANVEKHLENRQDQPPMEDD